MLNLSAAPGLVADVMVSKLVDHLPQRLAPLDLALEVADLVLQSLIAMRGDRTMTTNIIDGQKGSSPRKNFGLVNGVHLISVLGEIRTHAHANPVRF